MKPAPPEPAYTTPKPRVPLESAPGILSVRRSRLALVGRSLVVVRNQIYFLKNSRFSLSILGYEGFSITCLCHTPRFRRTHIGVREGAPGETAHTQSNCHRLSTNRLGRMDSQLSSPLEGESGPAPAGKPPPPSPNPYSKQNVLS